MSPALVPTEKNSLVTRQKLFVTDWQAVRPEERLEMRYEEQGTVMPAFTNSGWPRDIGKKERGRKGDSGEREVVPVRREKAQCFWSADRPVKMRRAQGHRPEGFTGLCSFLCGSSVSTSAAYRPSCPCMVPPASPAT